MDGAPLTVVVHPRGQLLQAMALAAAGSSNIRYRVDAWLYHCLRHVGKATLQGLPLLNAYAHRYTERQTGSNADGRSAALPCQVSRLLTPYQSGQRCLICTSPKDTPSQLLPPKTALGAPGTHRPSLCEAQYHSQDRQTQTGKAGTASACCMGQEHSWPPCI
jgi:hypothetical protein